MRRDPSDEAYVASLVSALRAAIQERGAGDVDRTWGIEKRLAEILVAQGHARLAELIGLARAGSCDTLIEVVVGGERHAVYEASDLRNEVWVGLLASAQSAISEPRVLAEIMARNHIGDEALPAFDRRKRPRRAPGGS